MSDDELEELRRRRLLELQQKTKEDQRPLEVEKQALLNKILTPEAKQRLVNIKIVKPDFVDQLELQIIQLAQQRKISIPLNDVQLKQILFQLQARKHEPKIRRI
jgi:programmed cell death protein 5